MKVPYLNLMQMRLDGPLSYEFISSGIYIVFFLYNMNKSLHIPISSRKSNYGNYSLLTYLWQEWYGIYCDCIIRIILKNKKKKRKKFSSCGKVAKVANGDWMSKVFLIWVWATPLKRLLLIIIVLFRLILILLLFLTLLGPFLLIFPLFLLMRGSLQKLLYFYLLVRVWAKLVLMLSFINSFGRIFMSIFLKLLHSFLRMLLCQTFGVILTLL